jgi:hypothetical protein
MRQQLLEDVYQYFSEKENPTQEEKDLLVRLSSDLPHFHITSVHRDDLEQEGFDVTNVTDEQMIDLADKMADDYCDQLFWGSLTVIAGEIMGIPRKTDPRCPECGGYRVEEDGDGSFYCETCDHEWNVFNEEK